MARPLWYSEHNYYEEQLRGGDWGYFKLHVYGGTRHFGTTYQDPFLDQYIRPVRMNPKREWFQTGLKYGEKLIGIYDPVVGESGGAFWTAGGDLYDCPVEFIGECFDPEKATFYKTGSLDRTNPKAMAWLSDRFENLLLPYKGCGVAFVTTGETGGMGREIRHEETRHPVWSLSALASYRTFIGNPKAKLPTKPNATVTPRTTNKVADEEIVRYLKWWRRTFTQRNLAMYEGAWKALGGDRYYKGGAIFDSRRNACHSTDLELVGKSPAFGIFVCEYPRKWMPYAKYWHNIARKNDKLFFVLQYGAGRDAGMDTSTYGGKLLCFRRWGVDADVDGLIMCSLKTRGADGEVWRALCARYYDKGAMSKADAEAYLNDIEAKIKAGKLDRPVMPKIHKNAKRLAIKKVSNLKIDGDLSDWQGMKRIPIGRLWRLYEPISPNLARGLGWQGDADLSGEFMIGYDAKALYIAVVVNDDTVINRDQQKIRPHEKKTTLRRGDGAMLELYGPPDPRVAQTWPARRRIFQLIPGREWPHELRLSGSKCASQTTKTGYVVEAAIPWKLLGKPAPGPGGTMGFDIYLHDRDNVRGNLEPVMRVFSTVGPNHVRPWHFTKYLGAAVFE